MRIRIEDVAFLTTMTITEPQTRAVKVARAD